MTGDRASRSIPGGAELLEIAGISDIGPVRTQNQDVWAAKVSPDGAGAVLALADGMGGHKGGLESADAAITGAMAVLTSAAPEADPRQALREAVAAASRSVAGVRDQIGGNPGTTLVLAVVRGAHATIVNVGDSRAYLIHGAAVTQITEDHSWAAAQVRAGAMSAEEARHHQKRNLIERAVMGDPVEADVFEVDAAPGDVLLLCSDGLWEPLADSALGAVLSSSDPLGVALTRACDAALAGGGTDNVTMVANRWLPAPSATV
ncbi:MAG TPA: protein phosphatase 2C domain-containing protein [Candidatus Acidoferrales bacterium]|nr:protein phosphatase 2C domain-containing protein [Candidatus Acidoferrales bacterium]